MTWYLRLRDLFILLIIVAHVGLSREGPGLSRLSKGNCHHHRSSSSPSWMVRSSSLSTSFQVNKPSRDLRRLISSSASFGVVVIVSLASTSCSRLTGGCKSSSPTKSQPHTHTYKLTHAHTHTHSHTKVLTNRRALFVRYSATHQSWLHNGRRRRRRRFASFCLSRLHRNWVGIRCLFRSSY